MLFIIAKTSIHIRSTRVHVTINTMSSSKWQNYVIYMVTDTIGPKYTINMAIICKMYDAYSKWSKYSKYVFGSYPKTCHNMQNLSCLHQNCQVMSLILWLPQRAKGGNLHGTYSKRYAIYMGSYPQKGHLPYRAKICHSYNAFSRRALICHLFVTRPKRAKLCHIYVAYPRRAKISNLYDAHTIE